MERETAWFFFDWEKCVAVSQSEDLNKPSHSYKTIVYILDHVVNLLLGRRPLFPPPPPPPPQRPSRYGFFKKERIITCLEGLNSKTDPRAH